MEANKAAQAIMNQLTLTKKITHKNQTYTVAEYERGRLMGRGGFSLVYQVRQFASAIEKDNIGNVFVAKQMPIAKKQYEKMFENEIIALKTIKSLNIQNYFTKIYDQWRDEKFYYIIFQKYRMGSLLDLHRWCQKYYRPLKKQQILYFIHQILKALEILHNSNITHGDIKLQNILLDDDFNIKIIDFGLARIKGQGGNQQDQKRNGTPYYMAPQLLARKTTKNCRSTIDVWATGVLLYYLIFSKFPYEVEGTKQQDVQKDIDKVCNRLQQQIIIKKDIFSDKERINKNGYGELVTLAKFMLNTDETKRKTVTQLLNLQELPKFWNGVQGIQNNSIQQKANDLPIQNIKMIKTSLYNDNRIYFNSQLVDSSKWNISIIPKCNELPYQLALLLRDKRKVRVVDVVYLKKYGFFFLLSNDVIFAYFNDHHLIKFNPLFQAEIGMPEHEIQMQECFFQQQQEQLEKEFAQNKIDLNKKKIIVYVKYKYFRQKIQANKLIMKEQYRFGLLQKQQCKIHKVFYQNNALFVRLTNQTLQVFFQNKQKINNLQNQQLLFNRCVTLNNNQKNKNQIVYKKDKDIYQYQNYDDAIKEDSVCRKYMDYIKKIFQLILDNSQISLQNYGYKKTGKVK